jgi:crotonobetainyl-CoA:carnitine CoA-transferase CaiB-like acyl-CoA transferase
VRKLAARSDVLIENFKVGGLAKFGLDYKSLKDECPRLIYCSVTGFGQDGPYAKRAGYDLMAQGMGGVMDLTGMPDGEPTRIGIPMSDIFTGCYSVIGILAALEERHRTGKGAYVDTALVDSTVGVLSNQALNYLVSGNIPKRVGNAHANIVPYQTFACSDGHIIVAAGNDGQYQKFVEAGGRPELARDPRFATNPARVQNRDVLVPLLADMVRERPRAEWIALLEAVGVPCGPINDLDEVFANEQVRARGMEIALPHPTAGQVRLVRSPMRMSATPATSAKAPPLLGEHTDDVLREVLGKTDEEIAALRKGGVV